MTWPPHARGLGGGELQRALVERGIHWRSVGRLGDAPAGDLCVVAVGKAAPIGLQTKLSDGAEAFALAARQSTAARSSSHAPAILAGWSRLERSGRSDARSRTSPSPR
jgi:hypothetical protein